ncbi:NAD-dependent epimerase/dehydratase family protein [Xylanimonas ulmi]
MVIGGNGFIGSHVVDALIEDGHEVTVFDRFDDDPTYVGAPAAEIVGDFLNNGDVRGAVKGQDVIYHLLSTTTPATAEEDPLIDVRTNIPGSIDLFREAVDAGVGHVYYASSGGAIYGSHTEGAVSEEAVAAPVSPYAIGKLAIEQYLAYFERKHGLRSTVFRISNPYGPRQHALRRQGVIPIFLRNLADGRPLTVFGDGTMVRDYIYVTDLAAMLVTPLGRDAAHRVYNLGSGTGHSINEIIDGIHQATGIEPTLVRQQVPSTFVDRITLDVSRFHAEFGAIANPTTLLDGIVATWNEIKAQDAARRSVRAF